MEISYTINECYTLKKLLKNDSDIIKEEVKLEGEDIIFYYSSEIHFEKINLINQISLDNYSIDANYKEKSFKINIMTY